ncbi:SAP domain-containing protein [Nakamurella leprariae]|uniref:SAP domain-containing protein n=1 Tax=Nakamurella leprariae TaxID=2803911 RepID=A0A938Y5A2_9ACTN|nr:SAP domain-containing protein [Nakamurella leprariae]MBM9466035.1 SAP domain-containing protein [Nakamurella leprariae]
MTDPGRLAGSLASEAGEVGRTLRDQVREQLSHPTALPAATLEAVRHQAAAVRRQLFGEGSVGAQVSDRLDESTDAVNERVRPYLESAGHTLREVVDSVTDQLMALREQAGSVAHAIEQTLRGRTGAESDEPGPTERAAGSEETEATADHLEIGDPSDADGVATPATPAPHHVDPLPHAEAPTTTGTTRTEPVPDAATATAAETATATDTTPQPAKEYGGRTRADLQAELRRRDLPAGGTMAQMRERLIADDQQS